MGRRLITNPGDMFGKWTVISKAPNIGAQTALHCKCECGTLKPVQTRNLHNGLSKSCGDCHGMYGTPEYEVWANMKARCYNKNNPEYHNYGGRGIAVCDSWRNSFLFFFRDMGFRPKQNYSIDRKDNDKGYYKENCRWADASTQMRNTRRTRLNDDIVKKIRSNELTVKQAAAIAGCSLMTCYRVKNGLAWLEN